MRWTRVVLGSLFSVGTASLTFGCGDSDGDTAGLGGSAGQGGSGGDSAGGSSGSGGSKAGPGGTSSAGGAGGGTAGSAGSAAGNAGTGGGLAGGAGSAGTNGGFVIPAKIGGACEGSATVEDSCSGGDPPVQIYCSLNDPTKVIMAVCPTSEPTQCDVIDECGSGWHACTATDYLARGGRDVAPNFSATNRAWLAACVRDVNGLGLRNLPCSSCGQDPNYEPSIQWWCDGEVVYAGGMSGDALGIHTSADCMRVGENLPDLGAYWTMGFTTAGPAFVMCCADAP